MQQQVGYKLIESASGNVIQEWGGVWGQCPGVPNPVLLPDGAQVCGMQIGDTSNGYRLDAWMMEPPAPTVNDVLFERTRRLAGGFDYNFGTTENPDIQHIGTTFEDMSGWNEVTTWANAQVALQNTTATVEILTDTGRAIVTALQWMQVLEAASHFRQPVWQASFLLQAMNPIPADYTDNKWWPVIGDVPVDVESQSKVQLFVGSVPYPDDGQNYTWNEDTESWVFAA